MFTDVLILAGGSGERLWPVSDAAKPKQFMSIGSGESFLQSAIRKAWALNIEGDICVVTRKEWTSLVIDDVRSLASSMRETGLPGKVLVMSEPCGKNTAPAIVWTAHYLSSLKRETPVNILLMASDHVITPEDSFVNDARTAAWHAERGFLVSFSIPPATPATGYGYIRAGNPVPCPLEGASPSFVTDSFREKPDAATAKAWVDDGHYYWNSGIYGFLADFYLEESRKHSPAVSEAFARLGTNYSIEEERGIRVMRSYEGLEEAYRLTPSISIDYAISEKCERSVTVRATFLWDDVGSWDSLSKYFDAVPGPTACVGRTAYVESKNCFVLSDIPVALCGVDDLIVVIHEGKALVSRRGETNLVKNALSLLKEKDLA
jgi:mannose-1-phosphate guanylyltransferase